MTNTFRGAPPRVLLWLTLAVAICLTGCDNNRQHKKPGQETTETYGPPVDAPPDDETFDVQRVADWDIRPEPASEFGNHSPYEVLGQSYEVTHPDAHFSQTGLASWYGKKFHGRLTSNRETFDMYRFTAAHRTLPLPSYVRVTNLKNGRSLVVRVNDRGPFKADRIIDLSWAAAKKLGYVDDGITKVRIELVQAPQGDMTDAGQSGLLFLQVGAFADEQKAKTIAKHIGQKTQSTVHIRATEHSQPSRLYRVRVGPLANQAQIQRLKQRLKKLGFEQHRLVVE